MGEILINAGYLITRVIELRKERKSETYILDDLKLPEHTTTLKISWD